MKLEEVGQVFVDGRVINADKVSSDEILIKLYEKAVEEEDSILKKINKITGLK